MDDSKRYRYVLWRNFVAKPANSCLWVMLNPSTADEYQDDPTIRRCQRFSRSWGYDACRVVNMFAYRSTNPDVLRAVHDPIGPENDIYIKREAASASRVVVAWGAHGALHGRSVQVRALLSGSPCWCFGLTKSGEPLHPLYQHSSSALVVWEDQQSHGVIAIETGVGPDGGCR